MTASYVLRAVLTAFRTARFDGKAIGEYDQSFEGFFRSFFAAVLAFPIHVFLMIGEAQVIAEAGALESGSDAAPAVLAPGAAYFLADGFLYALDWLAFPLLMIGVSRLIGAGHRYVPYIVAYNWGSCIALLATVPPYLLYLMQAVTLSGFLAVYYVCVAFVIAYRWRLARDGLMVPPATAVAIVILDLIVSALLMVLAVRMLGL